LTFIEPVQNALGNPAWRRMALAVWRLGMPSGTEIPLGDGAMPDFVASLALPHHGAARGLQQARSGRSN
jgi:hypothetical protein